MEGIGLPQREYQAATHVRSDAAFLTHEHHDQDTVHHERLYARGRWVAFGVASAASVIFGGVSVPRNVGMLVLLAGWAIGATLLLNKVGHRIRLWVYLGDLLSLGALAWLSGVHIVLVWMFLPSIMAGFQLRRRALVAVSGMAAVVGLLVHLGLPTPDLLGGLMYASVFAATPWFVNMLLQQWNGAARRRAQLLEQQATLTLAQAEAYRERSHVLCRAATACGTSAIPRTLLENTLDACATLTPYSAGAVLVPTPHGNELAVLTGRNISSHELSVTVTTSQGKFGMLEETDRPVLLAAHSPELDMLPTLAACEAALLLPVCTDQRAVSVVALGGAAQHFTEEAIEQLAALVNLCSIAIQHRRVYAQLQGERKTLLQRENELRRKIHRDIHNGPAQALAALTLHLEFVKRLQHYDPSRVQHELEDVIVLAHRMSRDMRATLFDLRPMTLEQQGLVEALEHFFKRFAEQPATIVFEHRNLGNIDRYVQHVLLGLIQDAVSNAVNHAQARTIQVCLKRNKDQLVVSIKDDGIGFDLAGVRKNYAERGGLGLLNIEERAKLVNAKSTIRSAPQQGTTVEIVLDVDW